MGALATRVGQVVLGSLLAPHPSPQVVRSTTASARSTSSPKMGGPSETTRVPSVLPSDHLPAIRPCLGPATAAARPACTPSHLERVIVPFPAQLTPSHTRDYCRHNNRLHTRRGGVRRLAAAFPVRNLRRETCSGG